MGHNERRHELRVQGLHDQMATMREELEASREALVLAAEETGSLELAHGRQMAGLAEDEAEKRVAHLQQQAMRRIANAGIASGFSTWQAQWEEQARKKRMLAAAGARLARPALAAAVAHWVDSWRQAEQVRQAAEAAASKQALISTAGSIQSKLQLQLTEVRLARTLTPNPNPNPHSNPFSTSTLTLALTFSPLPGAAAVGRCT